MNELKRLVKSFQQMGEERYGSSFSTMKVVEDLEKALTLGNYPPTAGTTTSDAGPLRLQNLDSTMTSVLFTERHIKLWAALTKVPSIQPYYEWNRRRSYGSQRHSIGFAEGGTPNGQTASYERNGIYTKFLGVKRGITHQLTMTGQLGGTQLDPVSEENRNGAMELMGSLERGLLYFDSLILDSSGASVMYDGLIKQMTTGARAYAPHVVDKAGAPLDFTDIEEAGMSLYKKGYVFNFDDLHMLMTPDIITDLSKMKFDMERKMLGAANPADGYRTGVPLSGHDTNYGRFNFDPWIFGERVEGDSPLATTDPSAPAQPAAWNITINAPVQAGSKFVAATTRTVYSVSAGSDKGEGIPRISTNTTGDTLASGSVTVTFPAAPAGTPSASFWRVYRGVLADGSDHKWIADVPIGSATFTDLNAKIPGTGIAIVVNRNSDTMAIPQMTPLIRFPLAITSTTIEWLLLLYHTVVLKAGERAYIWTNVGRLG